jgi:hypothetical protein
VYPIWHFALEHADEGMNYGVYANGGLLVETCSIRSLKSRSNMSLTGAVAAAAAAAAPAI